MVSIRTLKDLLKLFIKQNQLIIQKIILSQKKKNYLKRVKNIYKPKAEFLKSNIKNYNKLNILDFGAGSGYFLAALKEVKINNFLGLEISNDQVSYGKNMLKKFIFLQKNLSAYLLRIL